VYQVSETNLADISLTYNYKANKDETAEPGTGTKDINNKKVTGSWSKEGIYSDIKVTAADKAGNVLKCADNLNLTKEGDVTEDNGTVTFNYSKLIYLTSPKAYIYYDTGETSVSGEKAKMYLYKETEGNKEVVKAYVSGSVIATKVTIEDKFLWFFPGRYKWETNTGVEELKYSDLDPNDKTKAELENINVVTQDGEDFYDISVVTDPVAKYLGLDLKVIERPSVPGNVVDKNNVWPSEGHATTDNIHFVMDTAAPEYTSTEFTQVTSEEDNVELNDGVYTAYYGKSSVETIGENKGIKGSFIISDANLNTDASTTGAMCVSANTSEEKYSNVDVVWPETLSSVEPTKNGNEYTYNINATGNGVYRFIVFGEDKAGNKLVKNADSSGGGTTYNKTVPVAGFGETDDRFWSMKKVVDTVAPTATLNIVDPDKEEEQTADKEKAIYNLVLQGKEQGEEEYDSYTVNGYNPFQGGRNDGSTENNAIQAKITVSGTDSSPISVSYKINTKTPNSDSTVDKGSTTEYSNDRSLEPVILDKDVQFTVKNMVIKDRAGNETILGESNIVYLDGTRPDKDKDMKQDVVAPVPSIKVQTSASITHRYQDGGWNLYNDTVNLQMSAKDPNAEKSSSGLKLLYYTVTVNNKDKRVKPDDDESTLQKFPLVQDPTTKSYSGIVYNSKEFKKEFKRGVFEANKINVTLVAIDNAGNIGKSTITFGIDTVAPEVTVKFDNNDAQNGKYFKSNRTATVTVEERNLGEKSGKININTQVNVPESWSYSKGSPEPESGDNDTWTKKLNYTKDGDYTLTITGTDALGNKANVRYEGTAPQNFVIDKTAPVLKVTFDNNSVRNKKYYRANRTATVNVVEHNFRPSEVKVAGKASGPRKTSLGFPSMGKFSSKGDSRNAAIQFLKEGNFSFTVDYTDLAGNPAKKVVIDEFVIDKTNPTVKIENVLDGGIYGGTVAPRAIYDDDNFSKSDSTFRFNGVRTVDRSNLVPDFRPNGEYGGSYVMSDFPKVRANDDIYTAYASSTDMAGNSTTVQLSFSVNRFGSTFDYNGDETTINLVSKDHGRYYTNEAVPLEIREINVNPITKYELTLDRGGNSSVLKEGTDYTVVKGSNESGTTYVYKIKKDIVTDEGSYNIVVKSEDAAGNINTNAAIRSEEESEEVPVRFIYDKTAPTASFTNIKEGNSVIELKEEGSTRFSGVNILDLGIVPEDDWALGSIQYVLEDRNGVIYDSKVIEGDKFWEVMGEDGLKRFEQEIQHGSNTKSLTVTVWDAAGNKASHTYKLLVTSNPLEVALHYWYWVVAAIIAAGFGYAYYRKRKKDSEESEAA
jgi:hypothetical protein